MYEDLQVGTEIPPLVKGPLSTAHLMRWSAAVENWHRIHYDHPFATDHEGLPGVVVAGSWKQQVLAQLVKDWAGDRGWVAELRCQFRGLDQPGDVITASGRVSGLRTAHEYGYVECELSLANQNGRLSTTGTAIIALPLKNGPEVPYPFPVELQPVAEKEASQSRRSSRRASK